MEPARPWPLAEPARPGPEQWDEAGEFKAQVRAHYDRLAFGRDRWYRRNAAYHAYLECALRSLVTAGRSVLELGDEIRHVAVGPAVVDVRNGEPEAGVLHECIDGGMRVENIRSRLLPPLRIGNNGLTATLVNTRHVSGLTTSSSLPRSSITFTATSDLSPAVNGALVVPER